MCNGEPRLRFATRNDPCLSTASEFCTVRIWRTRIPHRQGQPPAARFRRQGSGRREIAESFASGGAKPCPLNSTTENLRGQVSRLQPLAGSISLLPLFPKVSVFWH